MQSFVFVIFGSMLFMNSAFAADSLISSHTTHPVLEALPSASPQASFQIAKTYYLPDYQQQINNVKGDSFTDRRNEDDTNRNDTCSSGGYYSSPLGSGYNCSRVVYAHQACYSCTAKTCSGVTSVASCGTTGASGWTIGSKPSCYAGNTPYYTCTAKTCSGVTSVASCGTTGASGWTIGSKPSCYAGNTPYYTCSAKACASGSTNQSCSSGYKWVANNYYSGNNRCGNCEYVSSGGCDMAALYACCGRIYPGQEGCMPDPGDGITSMCEMYTDCISAAAYCGECSRYCPSCL